ncbi:hypothetical protein [Paenibacillus sp. GCM10023250]|uniref:hypothetical protein n=1 Tax=Paenibacillus sp. GCM10023250 TaxID=3252648 RepID=UPI00361E647A
MAEDQEDGQGAAGRAGAGRDAWAGAPEGASGGKLAGGAEPPGGERAEGGHSDIGPEGAAPEWRVFYRAVRDAVLGMRPEK